MAILEANNLTHVYGQGSAAVKALDNVNMSVEPQEFVAIMGPSGSGKSTLLHLLGGLDTPTQGRVVLDGKDLTKLDDKSLTILRRTKIGFVFQFFNLIPVLTAQENVALPLVLNGANGNATEQAAAWLKRVELADRMAHRPSELSGGQQQRVALARALVTDPAVVLADEPTGNLDSRGAEEMLRWLRRTVDEWGRTVVMVTHDPRMAAYADRIVFMKDGTVVDDTKLGPEKSAEYVFDRMEMLVER
ncbi:MAG TPA: ABC transporter ATP-binding protein [Chloroflexia bacterium]|nr:ABC transporter ATP-binding protein [Chloroflexia bacterium]